MSPRTRAVVFGVITLAWVTLAVFSALHGQWLVAVIDVVAAAATAAFAYRSLRPRARRTAAGTSPSKGKVKELRAPRPRKTR